MVNVAQADDLKIRAAWLYFVEGLTQEQVAKVLNLTRIKIVRLLSAARADGTVQISIQAQSAQLVALERGLCAALDLETAIVVPSAASPENSATMVGFAAGQWLHENMRDGIALAVGWGSTLSLALKGIAARECRGASVVSLMGSMTHSRAINPSAVARRMADIFSADCFQLTAPVFVSTPQIRQILFAEPALQELALRASRADLALISVGNMEEGSTLEREGLVTQRDIQTLRASGAVADVLGHFIDPAGQLVAHPLNERVMAVALHDVRSIPRVAIASGGVEKAAAGAILKSSAPLKSVLP
jgi:DNA-binding transcriptional regulator LsrR (DeoR family)